MKNDTGTGSAGRQRSAGASGHHNGGGGGSSSSNNNNTAGGGGGGLGSASTGQLGSQQRGQGSKAGGVRAGTAKYYDIASTILGKSGDVETVFHNAAKNGNLAKLEQILSQRDHANLAIDCRDKRTGNTALIWAAKRGHSKVVELLLTHGADPTLCNYEAQTAIELGFSPSKTVLLDWVDIDQEMTARLLLQAAWQGNLAMVCKLLASGGAKYVNSQNAEGLTPLMLVSRDIQLFERLAAQLNRYYSPVEVAEELMKAGAEIHVTDNDGRSSLHYASQSRAGMAERLVNSLIGGGFDPELRDKRLFTPIHLASQLGNTQNVVALIDGGSEVNVRGFGGLTPLHMTAYNDHQKTAVTLLQHGADVCIVDDRGLTALDLAKTRKMKMTLKEAWNDATKSDKDSGMDTDINSNVSPGVNENKNQGKVEETKKKKSAQKKRPEVIFDNLVKTINNPPNGVAANKNKPLTNVEKCRQRERKILEDVEALKAAHPVLQRETTRMLGTTRAKILPQIGRSSSPERSQQVCPAPTPDGTSPVLFSRSDEMRWSLEETRLQLLSRGRSVSDIKLGIGTRHSRLASLPSQEIDVLMLEDSRSSFSSSPAFDRRPYHQRAGLNTMPANMADIAASCEPFLHNTRVKRGNKPLHTNGHSTPTSPAFLTQQSFTYMNGDVGKDHETSPRQEDKFVLAMSSPMELLRSRSLLKEDFILEESRPKETTSGSDPASSASSLSSSSPRDPASFAPHSPSKVLKHDPSLKTLVEFNGRQSGMKSRASSINDDKSKASGYEFEGKPLIREPQRRIRRNSDNSASFDSCSSSADFSKMNCSGKFRKDRGIIRTHSQRNVPNLLNGSSLSPRVLSSINKSQSLESLSPNNSSEMPTQSPRMYNQSPVPDIVIKDANANTLRNERKLSLPNAVTSTKDKSILDTKSSATASLSNTNKSIKKSDEKLSDGKRQIAPFSGKARVLNNDELDNWDSLNQKGDGNRKGRLQEEASDPNCLFTPVRSVEEPRRSLTNCEGSNQNAQVTKSCTHEVLKNSASLIRPHTSQNENKSAGQTSVPKLDLQETKDIKGKPKQSVSFKNQNPTTKSTDIAVGKSAQSSTRHTPTRSISNPSSRSKLVSSSQDMGDKLAAKLLASSTKTLSQSSNITTRKDRMETNESDPDTSIPVNNMFVVSEDSMRHGSASKARMQERLASAKRNKNETQESAMKKEENADVATKDKPISKVVAKIEKSLKKNDTQIALQRKSLNSLQQKLKEGTPQTSNNKLSNSSQADSRPKTPASSDKQASNKNLNQMNKSKNSNVPSSEPNKKEGKPVSSTSTSHNLKSSSSLSVLSSQSSSSISALQTSRTDGALKQKPVTTSTSTKQSAASASSKVIKSEKSSTDPKQAKAIDPNVILTPRSTEPLVKIKLQSNSNTPFTDSTLYIQKSNTDIPCTPLIVNPYEEFNQNTSHSLQQSTKDAIVKLKKTSKPFSVTNKSSKKSSTSSAKRPLSGNSKQTLTTGKKRAGKSKEAKTDGQKEGRPKSSKKNGRLSKKKEQQQESTDIHLIEETGNPDTAIISGIGWRLSTSCIDSSNLQPAKEVPYAESPEPTHILYGEVTDDETEHEHLTREFEKLSHRLIDAVEGESMKINAPSEAEKQALEVFKEKITLNSPRFLETKRRQESQSEIRLPVLSNDGYPLMNLDMTQEDSAIKKDGWKMNFSQFEGEGNNEISYEHAPGQAENNEAVQREIFLNKLTPIPEASYVSRTMSAISKFDKSVKGEKLSQLLEHTTPRDETLSGRKEGNRIPKEENEEYKSPSTSKKESYSYEYTYTSSGKTIKKSQSFSSKSSKEKPVIERRFSETKFATPKLNGEDETIDEAIEEILSSTMSSVNSTSTLKGCIHKSNMSASNTLTEQDQNLLKILTSAKDSPFHARSVDTAGRSVNSPLPPSPQDDTGETIETNPRFNSTGKSFSAGRSSSTKHSGKVASADPKTSGSSSKGGGKPPLSDRSSLMQHNTLRSTNPSLVRATSMKETRSKGHNNGIIDIKALEISDEETKQLARVMNSLRHMELHAGTHNSTLQRDGFGGSAKVIKTSKGDNPKTPGTSLPASALVRPSSTGAAAKYKGKFHELKVMNLVGNGRKLSGNLSVASHDRKGSSPLVSKQMSGDHQPIALDDKLMETINGDLDHAADAAEIENLYIRLTERRDSLCGSEFSIDSVKSVNDTIQWKKGNILGKGAFGTVWCGLTSEGELIAVKQIELTTMDQAKAHHEYEKIQEEVELLKTLDHINIVGYLGTSLEDNIVSIFMQFIPGGSLASVLARFGALEESVFRRYTKQILEGVEYLHDNDVIHRDLKGANVMLMPTGVIKLIDFGCAKRLCINLNLSHTEILKSMKGTPFWMAPEVVNETGHGKKSDIWSIGCTVFEMAMRKPPWADMNQMAAIFAIGRGDKPVPRLPDTFSQDAIDFVSACMTRDQDQRPSATDMLNHVFITRRIGRKTSKAKEENVSVC